MYRDTEGGGYDHSTNKTTLYRINNKKPFSLIYIPSYNPKLWQLHIAGHSTDQKVENILVIVGDSMIRNVHVTPLETELRADYQASQVLPNQRHWLSM